MVNKETSQPRSCWLRVLDVCALRPPDTTDHVIVSIGSVPIRLLLVKSQLFASVQDLFILLKVRDPNGGKKIPGLYRWWYYVWFEYSVQFLQDFVASIFSVKPQLVAACFRTIETSRLIHTHSSFNPAEEATKRGWYFSSTVSQGSSGELVQICSDDALDVNSVPPVCFNHLHTFAALDCH